MDGFSDLNLFALVARHRNLAAAARELGVTPPSISKRLAQLEQRLGVRLVNRTTRRVSLTAEGEIYLANGSRILDDLAELEQLVTQSRAEPTGLLRVNASFGFVMRQSIMFTYKGRVWHDDAFGRFGGG